MDDHTGADHRLEVDGIPLDDLLPPPPSRSKRKEPNTILEADTILKTGMATALTATNKGFQMMTKMGYKPETNTIQPVEITLRRGRGGLGLYEEQKVKEDADAEAKHQELIKKRKDFENAAENMAHRLALQAAHRKLTGFLLSMLKLAFQLREEQPPHRHALTESGEIFDDPPPIVADAHIQAHFGKPGGMHELRALLASMELDVQEQHRDQLNQYLREDYLYCFYCARSFESQEELENLCPGDSEEVHQEATMDDNAHLPLPSPSPSPPPSRIFAFDPSPSIMRSMEEDRHA